VAIWCLISSITVIIIIIIIVFVVVVIIIIVIKFLASQPQLGNIHLSCDM
jgi:hypothetical protein